jgi:hypothetical protein
MALVVDRFDLRPDGTHRGFEDFCVLSARRTDGTPAKVRQICEHIADALSQTES